MYTTYISTNTQFLLFIGKLQGGPNSYPLLVHPVYIHLCLFHSKLLQYSTVSNKELDSESVTLSNKKGLDKQVTSTSAKSAKATGTGTSQGVTRQSSTREQLKTKPQTTKSHKCTHEGDNPSPQKSPPKKKMNSKINSATGGENSKETKQKELNPDHEELKRQIFTGIKLMLDPIKEDIEQIKLDQRGLRE